MHSRCLDFFLLSFGCWVGGDFFSFFLCSQHVPLKFPMCFSRVFPIAPHFNPICFGQSPTLLIYISGQKGEVFHLSIEPSILGEPSWFQHFFCNGAIKITQCKIPIKVGLVCHPQLININHIILYYYILSSTQKHHKSY
jgi:hypothetical protein